MVVELDWMLPTSCHAARRSRLCAFCRFIDALPTWPRTHSATLSQYNNCRKRTKKTHRSDAKKDAPKHAQKYTTLTKQAESIGRWKGMLATQAASAAIPFPVHKGCR